MAKIWVKTGARLHLGQLDLNGSLGRIYGGLGLAIDHPQLELTAEKSEELWIQAPEAEKKRVETIAHKYLDFYSLPGARINLIRMLPSHSGLGSGTQLALALGFALTRLYGLQPPLAEFARLTDREGSRSGIGVAAFENGGFLIDGGRPLAKETAEFYIPPLSARYLFPEEWAVILAIPEQKEKMFGVKEEGAFKELKKMEEEISGKISRLVLMQLIPALIEKDLRGFGQAVTTIQGYLGDYFAPVQGGRFATAQGEIVAKYMLEHGATGIGQSSWGPTVYGFTHVNNLSPILEGVRKILPPPGQVLVARGVNDGASWGWS